MRDINKQKRGHSPRFSIYFSLCPSPDQQLLLPPFGAPQACLVLKYPDQPILLPPLGEVPRRGDRGLQPPPNPFTAVKTTAELPQEGEPRKGDALASPLILEGGGQGEGWTSYFAFPSFRMKRKEGGEKGRRGSSPRRGARAERCGAHNRKYPAHKMEAWTSGEEEKGGGRSHSVRSRSCSSARSSPCTSTLRGY